MRKVKVFSASRKNFLDYGCQEATFSWNILWDSKVGAFTSSQTGNFLEENPCANSFKTFQPNFFWGGDLSRFQFVPIQRIFFGNFRCSTRSSLDDAKQTVSALSPAESPQSWHLGFVLRWALYTFVAGVMEARLKLHPMTCIFEDTVSLWFLKDYRFYIDYYFQSSPTHFGFTVYDWILKVENGENTSEFRVFSSFNSWMLHGNWP